MLSNQVQVVIHTGLPEELRVGDDTHIHSHIHTKSCLAVIHMLVHVRMTCFVYVCVCVCPQVLLTKALSTHLHERPCPLALRAALEAAMPDE